MKKPELYSVNALSKITGRDRRTLDKLLIGVTPAKVEKGRKFYRLEDVEAKLKEKPDRNLKDEKTFEEIRKLRIRNDRDEDKLVSRQAGSDALRKTLESVRRIMEQKLVNEWPSAVSGLDVAQCRVYGRRLNDQILQEFQGLSEFWKI